MPRSRKQSEAVGECWSSSGSPFDPGIEEDVCGFPVKARHLITQRKILQSPVCNEYKHQVINPGRETWLSIQ